jgi:outer membrane protein assembly complex protein YaeT
LRRVRTLKVAAWSFGGLMVLAAAVIGLLHTPPARRYLLDEAIVALDRQGLKLSASRLDYNLLTLRFELRDVRLQSKSAPHLPPLLSAARVAVDLDLRRLLRASYYVESATIEDPRVQLVITGDGTDNLPHSPQQPQAATAPVDYLVRAARLSGGSISFEDSRRQLRLLLPLGLLTVTGNPNTRQHEIRWAARGDGTASSSGRSLPLRDVNADLVLGRDDVAIRAVHLALGDSTAVLAGRISGFQNPALDLHASSDLSLAQLAEFAGVPLPVRGNLRLSADVSGPLGSVRVTSQISGSGLTAERFNGLTVQAAAAYDQAASRVHLPSLLVSAPWGTARGKGSVGLAPQAGESSLSLEVRAPGLDHLSPILHLPVKVASSATAQVEARWPALSYEQASGTATLRLQPAGGVAKDRLPLAADITATAKGNRVALAVRELRGLGASISGNVELIDRTTLAGRVSLDAVALSATLADAAAFRGASLVSGIEGSLTAAATLSGTVSAPEATITAEIPSLAAGSLQGIAVNLSARYDPRRLLIDDAQVSWREQRLRGAGEIGLAGPQPLTFTARTESLSAAATLAALGRGDLPVSGDFVAAIDAGGTVAKPIVSASLTATGLQAYREFLGTLESRLQFQNQRLELSGLRLAKPGGEGVLTAAGAYDVDARQFQVQASARDFRLSGLTLTDGTSVRGDFNLDLSGSGSIDQPSAALKLTAANLQANSQDLGSAEVAAQTGLSEARLDASLPRFGLTIAVATGMRAPYPATAEIRLADSDLSRLPLKLEAPLAGAISAAIHASGELENYRAGSVSAGVSKLDLAWNGVSVSADGPISAGYRNRIVTVERANLRADGSRVELAGSLPLDATAAGGALTVNAQLDLPGLVRLAKLENQPQVQGAAAIRGVVRGSIERLDPDLELSLDNGSFATPALTTPVTNASLRARIGDGALELETLSAAWGAASLRASGAVPFALLPGELPFEMPRRQGPARFVATLSDVDLAAIPGVPAKTSGSLSARLEAEAARPDLAAVRGTLTLPQLRLGYDTYRMEQRGESRIALENGIARIEQFQLTGPSTELALSGTVDAQGEYALQLAVDGMMDASLVTLFSPDIRARGATTLHAALSGTAANPRARGFIELADGQVSIADPRIGADGLNLRVNLDGDTATLARLEGEVNGGKLTGRGSVTLAEGKPPESDLSIQIADLFLDFPAGLKTVSDLALQLRTVQNHPVLRGTVLIKQGGFTDDLYPDKGLLAASTTPRPVGGATRNALLESTRLNVAVVTAEPIVVDNNLARAQISTQLIVLGSPYEPGLAGRLVIEEGGELTLQERRYTVQRGIVTFTNDRRIEPNLDLLAVTTVPLHDVTLQISGTPGKTETVLTADPELSEPEILALLVTGKKLEDIRGQEFEVAQSQVLSYLTGRVGSSLGRRLEGATGLSRVRIEPNLIAAETNPGARLTIGQDILSDFDLVYSMDLVNTTDQIYMAEYTMAKSLATRGVRQADGSWRFDFRHEVRFGGTPQARRTRKLETRRIGDVSVTGQKFFTPEAIRSKLDVKRGDRYDFFKLRQGMDRVTKMYNRDNLLEAAVRLRRQDAGNTVDLTVAVDPGARVSMVFEGASPPGRVQTEVRRVWHTGIFDAQRTEDATGVITAWLIGERYLTPRIRTLVTAPREDQKRVVFDIDHGPRFDNVDWIFEGARAVEPGRLRGVIEEQGAATDVYTRPQNVAELLVRFYQETGHLDAAVEKPRYELDPASRTGKVVFAVSEGPLYHVGETTFRGNSVFSAEQLGAAVPLPRGDEYRPILRENAMERLRDTYWERGYNDVEIQAGLRKVAGQARVDFEFDIVENSQAIAREIVVQGNRATSENLIRTQLAIRAGDPVNLEKLGESRRKLYNTGAFSSVEIAREELDSAGGPTRPVRLTVRVQEVQPFELKYGGFYDTERGPGGIADFANRNLLGSARVLGIRGRYDSQLQEARLYFSQPLLSRFPLKTVASPYIRREINPETDLTSAFNVDRVGFSLQQEAAFGNKFVLNYGYRIERSHTYDTGPDPFFDVTLRVAALTATLSRDTRDDPLDAAKGSFMSGAFQLSPATLGSQVRFVKYLGQYFRYFPLQKPRVELFTNQVLRPRLVFATGVRLGLAHGLGGQEVPSAERFFAGGATTIRGFEQNLAGPVSGTLPLGGQGMVILNNELRFPLFTLFGTGVDGAGFLDVGNAFDHVSDFRLADLRRAAGFGLRLRTPWFLLRLDYGFKLDRRPGESRGRFFGSIGQAF